MTYSARHIPIFVALLATLVLAPSAPEAGNILFLAAACISMLLILPNALETVHRPIVWMPLLALLLLAIAYVVGEGSLNGLLGLIYFAPLLAIWPLVTLAQKEADPGWQWLIAVMSLCGVAGACAMAVNEVLATGTNRAGAWVANPIHFADIALLVGFLSTAGLLFGRGWSRMAFLAGPLLSVGAVLLSGTRGAVIAAIAMVGVALLLAAVTRLIMWRQLALLGLGVVAIAGVALFSGAWSTSAVQRIVSDMRDISTSGIPQDASTAERLQMYTGALRAFLDSPLIGQGPTTFTAVALQMAESSLTPPHLHSDLADFAASAGLIGLLSYTLLVLAPLVELRNLDQSPGRSRLIVLIGTLISGFIVMGLTNAMFGILTVTCCYSIICICVPILMRSVERTPF